MAENGSETDINTVQEALRAQQQLLRKLYAELDKEREASATAASEALSMILRLQGEKAAVKMEASQYQRMAEEKICHAEESLATFEDTMYQKEMEIASLEFQVQAYRYKLLSLGCSDFGPCECRFADNLLENDLGPHGEIGVNSRMRRIKSLPPIQLEETYYGKDTAERETCEILKPDCSPKTVERSIGVCVQNSDLAKKLGHPNHYSYWEQIEMLDEQVKEISESKGYVEERSQSLNGGNVDCPSSSIQDIFEIPEIEQNLKACETENRLQKKLIFEDKCIPVNLDSVSKQPSELHTSPAKAKKASHYKRHKNKSLKVSKGKAVDSRMAPIHQSIDEIVVESQLFRQLCHRIDRLECERGGTSQEINDTGVEELRLLKEIQKQLNFIQSEMKSSKAKQPSPPDNLMIDRLREAMVYFWF